MDGEQATPELLDGVVRVVVEGIAAKDLDAARTFVISDADGGAYTYRVSPVDYMGRAVAMGVQPELNCAFYNYHVHAKAYLG